MYDVSVTVKCDKQAILRHQTLTQVQPTNEAEHLIGRLSVALVLHPTEKKKKETSPKPLSSMVKS